MCAAALGACSVKNDFAQPSDAIVTPSGLASKVLRVGLGSVHPKPTSKVTVLYSGWTPDGAMFDSNAARNEPVTFPLDQVIPGWTEGLQLMVKGEKRRFWVPATLGYGEIAPGGPKTLPQGQPLGPLVFDLELLGIQ
jgi:peptidylprolyl isomerase